MSFSQWTAQERDFHDDDLPKDSSSSGLKDLDAGCPCSYSPERECHWSHYQVGFAASEEAILGARSMLRRVRSVLAVPTETTLLCVVARNRANYDGVVS